MLWGSSPGSHGFAIILRMVDYPEHEQNRAAWDVTAALYEEQENREIALLQQGSSTLLPPEMAVLGDLRPWCSSAIHLQCAGGVDTLSLLRQGAQAVVGVDISERMIASARRKSAALNAPAQWFVADVLQPPTELDGSADLVHTGRGALPWLMDLEAWARVVYRLLKPGGRLHVFEGHPLDWAWDNTASEYRFHPRRAGYFSQAVGDGEVWPRPFIDRQPNINPAEYQPRDRQWTIGQTINAVIRAGLQIEFFDEYPLLFWNQFPDIPPEMLEMLPHSFSLLAIKPS